MFLQRQTLCSSTSSPPTSARPTRLPACGGDPRRPLGLQASREGQHDSSHPGPPDSLGAKVLRSVRRHRGATGRRATAARRSNPVQAYLDKYIMLAKRRLPACRGKRRLVANRDAVLRRAETAANLDLLAEGLTHLPPPDTGSDMAANGGSACPGDQRTIG